MPELTDVFAQRATRNTMHTKRYRHVWTQKTNGITYGDGINTWAAVYELTTSTVSPAVTCKVLIGVNNAAGGFTPNIGTHWLVAIKRVWSEKAVISLTSTAGDTITRRELFDIGYNDVNAEFNISCQPTPGIAGLRARVDGIADAGQRTDFLVALKLQREKAVTYDTTWPNWRKDQLLFDCDRDASYHGTPHMLLWGDRDSEAVPHEFGHTIGLPDEYNTTEYNGAAVPANPYNQPPFSTPSIMNNTVSSRGSTLYPRHFNLISTDLKDLMETLVTPGTTYGAPTVNII